MISILIPTYNRDVFPLARSLYNAMLGKTFKFEIICADDASPQQDCLAALQENLEDMPEVRLICLPENIGRARIRNLLAREAQFEYCWFLDADMMPPFDDFNENNATIVLHNYLFAIKRQYEKPFVICGGHCYNPLPPADSRHYLHWWYGQHREVRLAVLRARSPYTSFTTANFVISRSIFEETQFEETIRNYGHEDTIFGFDLAVREILFVHIDNPMEHLGLETADVFLHKTRQAVENLLFLSAEINLKGAPIRLLSAFSKVRFWRLRWLFAFFFYLSQGVALRKLALPKPNLRWLDWYKLGYLCKISRQKKRQNNT
jgi:glycosyltransferase involved in cell wall biosynthesis